MAKTLKLSKLDVARRQLDTAIALWFHEGEPVSAHALAFSANKVLRGVCQKRQIAEPILFDLKRIKKGAEKEYMRLIHAAPNFFKHADNDADEVMDFYPKATEFVIFDAVETYFLLTSHRTSLMTVFRFRFCLLNSHLWPCGILPVINEAFSVKALQGFTRKQFFDFFEPVSAD